MAGFGKKRVIKNAPTKRELNEAKKQRRQEKDKKVMSSKEYQKRYSTKKIRVGGREYKIQRERSEKALCSEYFWRKYQKPKGIIHRWDIGADIYIPKHRAAELKRIHRHERKYPDFFSPAARKGYGGLYIELKAMYSDLYTKGGEMKKSEHIRGQSAMLVRLSDENFYTTFGIGFHGFKQFVDWYFDETGTIPEPKRLI